MKWKSTQLPNSPTIDALADALSTKTRFPNIIANILCQRGMDSLEKTKAFFQPDKNQAHDPFLMKNMKEATQRILKAKQNHEKILIYGDYDVDGTTSVTLMALFLTDWGFDFDYYIPDRYKEGYGISFKGIEYAAQIGAGLIIALDCGIKANDKVKYANLKGIDFIICDHHTPGKELPDALAILDSIQEGCEYPCKDLTGCGVGLKLITGLTQTFTEAGIALPFPDYNPFDLYCDLVALSIACDIVPIKGENRIITYWGLKKIKDNPSAGIKAIKELSITERKWDISDLVFFVGPRINSAGRLGSAKDAVEVLLGKSDILTRLAEDLHDSNDDRKKIDADMTLEALQMIENDEEYKNQSSTVLYKKEWHKGVIGIVASRLIEKHYRPTILFTHSEGKLVGSARSVNGFDIYAALEQCADLMVQFGGHKYAAGMTIEPEKFPKFKQMFESVVSQSISPLCKEPVLLIDHELSFSEITDKFRRLLQHIDPFGPDNPEPVFATLKVKVTDYNVIKDTHIRLVLQHKGISLNAIGFNLAEKYHELNTDSLHIAYHLGVNNWNGKTLIQLHLKDIKAAN